MNLRAIEKFIEERTGISFDCQRSAVLRSILLREMADFFKRPAPGRDICINFGCDRQERDAYLAHIKADPDHFARLVNLLTINETSFFRESRYLDIMCNLLIPEILTIRGSGYGLSMLSAGCSTGEEPCSMAMAIAEKYGTEVLSRIKIVGADIDRSALERAKAGLYGLRSLRNLDEKLKQRYFTPAGPGKYLVRPFILNAVNYRHLNLVDDNDVASLGKTDLIFYRNVSIYFDDKTRSRVLTSLGDRLHEGGFMVVGSAETLSHETPSLELTEMDGLFLFRKKTTETFPESTRHQSRASHLTRVPVLASTSSLSSESALSRDSSLSCESALSRDSALSCESAISRNSARFSASSLPAPSGPAVPPCAACPPETSPAPRHRSDHKLLHDPDHKLLHGLDHKLLHDPDPKLLHGLDPKLLKDSDRTRLQGKCDMALALVREKRFQEVVPLLSILEEMTDVSVIMDSPVMLSLAARMWTLKGAALLHLCRWTEAREACETSLGLKNDVVAPYLILGMAAWFMNDGRTALKRFRQAIYLCPSNWLAHYYLSEIHSSMGDMQSGMKESAIVIKLLEKKRDAGCGLDYFPLGFSREEIIHLCRCRCTRPPSDSNTRECACAVEF
ncbi:MAG: hypothetical protein HQK66_01615 [Desulfamplus sp.]|nr:hypothetical protein [Desulfamplus sp.]